MAELMYFGKLGDLMGCSLETVILPETVQDTASLRRWLDADRGLCGALLETTVRIAINDEIMTEPCHIRPDDRIAFLPPVGGG